MLLAPGFNFIFEKLTTPRKKTMHERENPLV